ncbi:MAG: phosphoglycolate phosphatase [Limnobacter sp.]|uniref:phosphoglycolate phosphatase n=1 Tax=Limnobacter sp. TaxID=2003368 RepID=UPI002732A099|nr:phosphoglycolate phosphatase [Limnobacter sp.]MDP3188524.1 phosphoglycolate phosphatase [Limnobacter sp.]
MSRYKLLSFDLDGTLVHTAPEIVQACNEALVACGYGELPDAQIEHLIGNGTYELMRKALERVVAPTSESTLDFLLQDIMPVFNTIYGEVSGTRGQPYPGVLDALEEFKRQSIPMVVVTNKEHFFAIKVLKNTGLLDYFDGVVGGDSLSKKKPDALPLNHCMTHFDVQACDTAHIGDSSIDVQTARAAQVCAIAVSFGYNGGEPVATSKPDLLINHFDELRGHVLNRPSLISH